jgi:proteasome lid subunit RPN8/RPN11
MFAIVLLLAVATDVCGELCRVDAVEQYARLNALAAMTRYERERAAFLVRLPDGRLTTVPWRAGENAEASYTGHIPRRCVAVIHTHPATAPRPSKHDTSEATRAGLPIVVVTPQSVTVAMPQGTTDQLLVAGWTRRSGH